MRYGRAKWSEPLFRIVFYVDLSFIAVVVVVLVVINIVLVVVDDDDDE